MRPDRSWMMRRKDNNGQVTEEFKNGVDEFIEIAKRQLGVADVLGRIFCPCFKCKNCVREKPFWVEKHLYEHGFMENYLNWTIHGENQWGDSSSMSNVHDEEMETRNPYVDMVIDAMGDDLSEDHLKNARNKALRDVNSTDLVDTKGHGPKGMKAEVWDALIDIWLKPEWKKKSDANRCNRASLPDAVLHTGGSINFGEHKKRMEEELKHEVSYRDVYDRVHKKKDGEYISQRSRTYIESYDTAMLEKYREDFSTHPIVDSKVWTKSFGYKKMRQTFVGRSLDLNRSQSATMTTDANIISTSEEFIKKAVDRAMTSFVQSQLVPMLEPILSMIQSMHNAPMQRDVAEKVHGNANNCSYY